MRTSSGFCQTVSNSIRQHLSRFSVAAIVVVIGLFGLARLAGADVVYNSANITINQGTYNLDLNGDGVTDFTITSGESGNCDPGSTESGLLSEMPASGNGAIIGPLTKGNEIGPDQVFTGGTSGLASFVAEFDHDKCVFTWFGPWYSFHKATTGYLGLSFQLNGETYYGWAQLTVKGITATLTGYAYETIPGKAIKAGKKKGN
jgi:hypothetical protein